MIRLRAAACLLLTGIGVACSGPVPSPTQGDSIVYVIRREWHTDIGLPVDELSTRLAPLQKPFPGVRFLTFGFGERQFVVNPSKGIGAMLSALLPSQSALLMTALRATPEQAFGDRNVVILHLPSSGLANIEAAIAHEFEASATGAPTKLADGPYAGSVFYAARDTYDGLYTCNTWTAETLRAGGLPMPTAGVLFAGQVMGSAGWISTHQTAQNNAIARSEGTRQSP